MIDDLLERLARRENLTVDEADRAVQAMMQGLLPDDTLARLLTLLRDKGESLDEVVGAARAMRRHMQPIRTARSSLVDTCGTGGDRSGTFNISTAAAIVAAAAGVAVAKHGNRSFSSATGSADVLAELGVNIQTPLEQVGACLDELGIGFCFAPLCHPAMKHAAAVRKRLGFRTIFNLVGPLSNPASAPFQLIGVARAALCELLARAATMLGTTRTLVVHGADGLDEVSIRTETHVWEAAGPAVRQFRWTPEQFGLARAANIDSMLVESAAESAAVIRNVLAGKPGPAREVVVLNAAAALWVAGKSDQPAECARLAAGAIDSGAARDLLERLTELSSP